MTIPEQVDAYRALLDEKDRLAEETKANNRAIEAARDALATAMIEDETPQITRNGYSYTLTPKTKYSKAAGKDAELMDALRANGLGDLIKETVNAQSLQGAMSNLAEENDDELPEEFEGCVNVYSFKPALNSAAIRALGKTGKAYAAGTLTINVPAGTQRVAIACIATAKGVTKVINETAMNADVTSTFVKSTVPVEGANGYAAKDYNVWVFEPAVAYGNAAVLKVTLG